MRRAGVTINAFKVEITDLTQKLAPALLAIPGRGALTAAKIVCEAAAVDRFNPRKTPARRNGTAPLPVWSSNRGRRQARRPGARAVLIRAIAREAFRSVC